MFCPLLFISLCVLSRNKIFSFLPLGYIYFATSLVTLSNTNTVILIPTRDHNNWARGVTAIVAVTVAIICAPVGLWLDTRVGGTAVIHPIKPMMGIHNELQTRVLRGAQEGGYF